MYLCAHLVSSLRTNHNDDEEEEEEEEEEDIANKKLVNQLK
eukprot:COSAG05_NODE_1890_length_3884_cov_26.954029_1_plen_41_part_00